MTEPSLAEPLASIREQIHRALARAGRTGEEVLLIGVTKKKSAKTIAEAFSQGLQDFGENYVQEWQEKQKHLRQSLGDKADRIHWHFIGHLQGNKVKSLVGRVDWIHTVDSVQLAQRISRAAAEAGTTQRVLIQVNLAKEAGKRGFAPEQLPEALPQLAVLPHLSWRGLMAIPPQVADAASSRPHFRRLKSLLDECNQTGVLTEPLRELSMGMSQDFGVAIEEGATMIRMGTALFGPRE